MLELTRKLPRMKKFIDFDKSNNVFYTNLWLDDQKIAIKIPLWESESSKEKIRIEKFNLSKYTFILAYE